MSLATQGRIAVVGATGAVGREAMAILHERRVPADRVVALASARSVGTRIEYGAGSLVISEATHDSFVGVTTAIFCATSDVSRALAPHATRAGAVVIDNSSAFRMKDDVPLVVPGVNDDALRDHRHQIIANPNCSTIIMLLALTPLRRAFGVRSIVVSTYQAVSGAGAAAIDELRSQALREPGEPAPGTRVFREPCAFNVFSHNSAVDGATGVNGEERKMIEETHKIWGDASVEITPTCVRVPVVRAHSESIVVRLRDAASEAQVRAALHVPGLVVLDDREGNAFPTPLKATGRDDVLVGRIRPDPAATLDSQGRTDRWCLFVCADQLRVGAALNAVRIAEAMGGA